MSGVKITVETKTTTPTKAHIDAHWSVRSKSFLAMLTEMGKDMVQNARRNVRIHGDPAGDWPKLVGFGKARQRKRKGGDKQTPSSPHTGWARRKHLGLTPGRGRFGPGHLLRDTEGMLGSLVVDFSGNEREVTLSLDAKDRLNQIKLRAHSFGVPQNNLAKRDMTADMSWFEKRAEKRLEDHWRQLFEKVAKQKPRKPKA